MDIQIECRAEALDQRDRAGLGYLFCEARLLDQVCGDDAVDDAQHPAHDLRPTGEQEAQWKRETEYPLAHGLFGQDFIDQ